MRRRDRLDAGKMKRPRKPAIGPHRQLIASLIARLPESRCAKLPSRESKRRQTIESVVDDWALARVGRTHAELTSEVLIARNLLRVGTPKRRQFDR